MTQMKYLKNNLWEIQKSSALQFFGAALALSHILTWLDWFKQNKLPLYYYSQASPMCWSIWESCHQMRFLPLQAMEFMFNSYLAISILAFVLFLLTRFIGFAWFLMILLVITKGLLYFQDFRLSSNTHYFLLLVNLAFLFALNKQILIKYLIVSCFVASGLLKLYPQWMTGQWFEHRLLIPVKLAEWMAALGFLVETIAPIALLFKDSRFFVLGFISLLLYYSGIWYVDSFYTPTIMLTQLSFFLALVYEKRKSESEFLYQSYIRPEPSRLWVSMGILIFWMIQGLGFLPKADPQLRRLGETLSMDPMAAASECESSSFALFDSSVKEIPNRLGDMETTQKCSAYMAFTNTKALCQEFAKTAGFRSLSSYMYTRSMRDSEYHTTFEVSDFCNSDVTFKKLGAN